MRSKIQYLIPILAIIFLIFPLTARADPLGIVNWFGTSLEGVEEVAGKLVAAMLELFLAFVTGLVALVFSSLVFGMVIDNPNWLSLGSEMIDSGWHFIAGLANMFLILILIFIAIQFILKIETFRTKKALINLIIVALLINFSLLFVKIIVDVPIFALNSFKTAAGVELSGLVISLVNPLIIAMGNIMIIWIGIIIGLGVAFAIPISAPFAQLGFVFAFPMMIPILALLTFFIIAAFLLAGIFITYIFLFGARIVILTIFAILAPLAFLCLILPQTKKYWDLWLKTVIQWSFLGVALIFFLVLGFKGLQFLTPSYVLESQPDVGFWQTIWIGIKAFFFYYFFLFIYLVFVAYINTKHFMPQFASAFIDHAKQIGATIWARGIKPIGQAAWIEARKATAQQERKERERAERGEKLTRGERIGKAMRMPISWAYKATGTTAEIEAKKEAARRLKEEGKELGDLDKEEILNIIHRRRLWARATRTQRMAAFKIGLEKGWLTDAERPYHKEAAMYGVEQEEILKRYPHWAADLAQPQPGQTPAQAQTQAIREQTEKMEPEELRKNIQRAALENVEVVANILRDIHKIEVMAKAKLALRKQIVETTKRNWAYFRNLALTEPEVSRGLHAIAKNPKYPT